MDPELLGLDDMPPMNVVVPHRAQVCVSMELTEANVAYLRAAARKYPFVKDMAKRCLRQEPNADYPNVRWNKQRRCWYIKTKDLDGRVQHLSFKVKTSDVAETAELFVHEAAMEAQRRYDELNVEGPDVPGGLGDTVVEDGVADGGG